MSFVLRNFADVVLAHASDTPDRPALRFLSDATGEGDVLTYGDLDRRARAVAAALHDAGAAGERVLLAYPPGIHFIVAFIGTLYAGAAAVPIQALYPGRLDRASSHLGGIVQDAAPAAVLTLHSLTEAFAGFGQRFAGWNRVRVIVTDTLPDAPSAWRLPPIDETTTALVQYTSGSTSAPRGVIVTHGNLLHNAESLRLAMRLDPDVRGVVWLPPHHDMGLIGGILEPLYVGFQMNLMSPLTLLQRPLRWLQAVSRWRATITGGPNFAFEFAVSRTTAEQRASLRLNSLTVTFTGAEPIRAATLDRFAEAFAPSGFRPESFHPCYGLAESTLIVTGGGSGVPILFDADAEALEQGRAVKVAPGAHRSRRLVGCGRAVAGQRLAIVNPDTCIACADGEVGEVWVGGGSVARGYWNRPDETARLFQARIAGSGEGPFLRTGDLGVLHEGELFVTGRIKHLIIIDGRNHYPHDIEATAERSHPAVRPASAAAFAVDDGGSEQLVVAVEVDRGRLREAAAAGSEDSGGNRDIVQAIRGAVAEAHDVPVHAVVLLPPGGVPRTTSGKIQRHLCGQAFESRTLASVVGQ
jgi:acyl-CoA synthetase (AMP-forming)/AMP-acid ligase II